MQLNIDFSPLQGRVTTKDIYKVYNPPPPLNRWIHSFWQLNVPPGQFCYHSIPDNSVDWIINVDCFEDSVLVPPFLSANIFEIQGPARFFGIRFRLLGQQSLIQPALGEWGVNQDVVNTADILPKHLLYAVFESVSQTPKFQQRCEKASVTLQSMFKQIEVDPRVARFVHYCYQNTSSNLVLSDQQCAEFGISSRQLRRLTQLHLGMKPKDFAAVLRFQKTLIFLNSHQQKGAWLDCYYDQSHFIREFKRFSGLSPVEFLSLSVLYNRK